jgi:hypothetical protein
LVEVVDLVMVEVEVEELLITPQFHLMVLIQ